MVQHNFDTHKAISTKHMAYNLGKLWGKIGLEFPEASVLNAHIFIYIT